MEYGAPRPLERLNRALSWTFRVGRFFGSEVRVYGTVGLVWLFSIYEIGKFAGVGFIEAVAIGTISTVGLYLIVWTHEMGHAFAGRAWNIRTPRISLSVFGGLAHLDSAVPGPKADILVALAGPATHLVWLAVLWPASRLYLHTGWSAPAGWSFEPLGFFLERGIQLNLYLMLFNLLPVYPLDGGRAFRGLLATRMNANKATLVATKMGMVGGMGLVVWGLMQSELGGVLLTGIGLMVTFSAWTAHRGARYGDGPYGAPRDPWAFDDEAWRHGESPAGDDGSRPGYFARRRLARDRAREEASRDERERDAAELDRLLARVSEAGIAGLTPKERSTLQRLSEARRGR